MTDRQHFLSVGDHETVTTTALLLGSAGAKTFELAWSSPFVEADAGDAPEGVLCSWTARVTWPDDSITEGHAGPGVDHCANASLACTDLLAALGAHVAVLDLRPDDTPR